MFDIGASELLLTVIVAIVVIGPKDLPRALRLAGSWIAKVRRVSGHFRSGIEEMIRQAELEEMEKKWREQNEAIMKETGASPALAAPGAEPLVAPALPEPLQAPEAPAGAAQPPDPHRDTEPAPPVSVPSSPSEPAARPAADLTAPELPLGPPKGQP